MNKPIMRVAIATFLKEQGGQATRASLITHLESLGYQAESANAVVYDKKHFRIVSPGVIALAEGAPVEPISNPNEPHPYIPVPAPDQDCINPECSTVFKTDAPRQYCDACGELLTGLSRGQRFQMVSKWATTKHDAKRPIDKRTMEVTA